MTSFGHHPEAYQDEEHEMGRTLAASIAHHGAAISALKWHLKMDDDGGGSGRLAANGRGFVDFADDWRSDWRAAATTNASDWRADATNGSSWSAAATNGSDWRAADATNGSNWRADATNGSSWSAAATNGSDWRAADATNGSNWRADATNGSSWSAAATNGSDWRAADATNGSDWRAAAATNGSDWRAAAASKGSDWRADAINDNNWSVDATYGSSDRRAAARSGGSAGGGSSWGASAKRGGDVRGGGGGVDWRIPDDDSAAWRTSQSGGGCCCGCGCGCHNGLLLQPEERIAGVRAYLERKLRASAAATSATAPTTAAWRFPRSVQLPSPPPTMATMATDAWYDARASNDCRPFDGAEGYEAGHDSMEGYDLDYPAEAVRARYEYRQEEQPVCTDTSLDGTANWPYRCRPFFFRRADAPSVRYY